MMLTQQVSAIKLNETWNGLMKSLKFFIKLKTIPFSYNFEAIQTLIYWNQSSQPHLHH